MTSYSAGTIVTFRDREWVVVKNEPDLLLLKPITGNSGGLCRAYLPIEGEHVRPGNYPHPTVDDVGDFESARLLRDATRLLLQNGTNPLRSLGHISFRPRPYQLVPLMMALRLNPVRLLIADDVGIGKTIEAALIARELLDRGEIRRIVVLCPPRLCDQWQSELMQKFHIYPAIVRPHTLAELERNLPRFDLGVFDYYPNLVASIDFIKTERIRDHFLKDCPDLVIVDEAHTCADSASHPAAQQRHQLLSDLVKDGARHVILVTATPHSGIEKSFSSLQALLRTEMDILDSSDPSHPDESTMSGRFVQRRRADVSRWLETVTSFPERISEEVPYELSPQYLDFLEQAHRFCLQQARTDNREAGHSGHMPIGLALEFLRCVMSSPGAARAALQGRLEGHGRESDRDYPEPFDADGDDEEFEEMRNEVAPRLQENTSPRGKVLGSLQALATAAQRLDEAQDTKIQTAVQAVSSLLDEGFAPIVFCHYVETAHYVARRLREELAVLGLGVNVAVLTGAVPDSERSRSLRALYKHATRVLVATDCLSEGMNLQEGFSAVVHYDLPWNPNKLEQREGRVDRFGQQAPTVKALLLYGTNNMVEAKLLNVLLRKSRLIRQRLGVAMPLVIDNEAMQEAILDIGPVHVEGTDPLEHARDEEAAVARLTEQWDSLTQTESEGRQGLTQDPVMLADVAHQIHLADSSLGDPNVVERFFRTASVRMGEFLLPAGDCWRIDPNRIPTSIATRMPTDMGELVAFQYPPAGGAEFISRNHPLTKLLAEHTLDLALKRPEGNSKVARVGVICSGAVSAVTCLLLLRHRFRLENAEKGNAPILEESRVSGFSFSKEEKVWLSPPDAEFLLETATPSRNLSSDEKKRWADVALRELPCLVDTLGQFAMDRAAELQLSYEQTGVTLGSGRFSVQACLPVDVLAVSIIIPEKIDRQSS